MPETEGHMTTHGVPPMKKLLAASLSSLCQSLNPQVNLPIPRPHCTLNPLLDSPGQQRYFYQVGKTVHGG